MVTDPLAEPIAITSIAVFSVPILIVFTSVPVPMVMVFALFDVPTFTIPVVPESSVIALPVVDLIASAASAVKVVAFVSIAPVEPKLRAAPELIIMGLPASVAPVIPS